MRGKSFYVKLVLKDEIVEDRPEFTLFRHREQNAMRSLLTAIERAREAKRVQALALVIKQVSIGWEQIEELHRELERFHQAGKRSLAYLEDADNKSYYLACGAQQIFLAPAAQLELVGLRAEILFFKNLLDYLGIEPEFFQLGEYKSAAEILVRENMSEANRRMTDSILTDFQERLKRKAAAARSVSVDQVQQWIDEGPYTASQALSKGLIDGLQYEDQLEETLKSWNRSIREAPVTRLQVRDGFFKRLFTFYRPQIAYLVAEGILTQGESRRGRGRHPILGSDTLVRFLRDARKSKRVKAVVVRVNSPGGSALASDLIWRELKLTNQKKPVVVSLGNLAASGGYYIATAARRILGLPGTLTGSIGVIGGKVNLGRLLEKIHLNVDSLEKGKRAGYLSPSRPFSTEEAEIIQAHMREFYEQFFLKNVAEARSKSVEAVREVAEGRVWTGAQAIQHQLLDGLGGISEALETARQEAGIPREKKVRLVRYVKRWSLRDLFSLPLLEALPKGKVLALMLDAWEIR